MEALYVRVRTHCQLHPHRGVQEDVSGLFILVHPWLGREYELVVYRRTWGEDRLFFYDERGRLIALPPSWTDFVSPDPFIKIAADRSLFQAEGLCELVEQIRSLHKKDGRHV